YRDCKGNSTGTWNLSNSTGSGNLNMYTGTRTSVNTYFAQLERDAGLCNTSKAAEAMGITVPYDPPTVNNQVPPFTLGPVDTNTVDMAAAYATTASGGKYCKPTPISEILDAEGETIEKYQPQCKRVMSKNDAAQINDILKGLQQPG